MLAILIIFAIHVPLHASVLEARYLPLMASARTTQELNQIRAKYEEHKVAALACKLQLKARQVPGECYHLLAIEEPRPSAKRLAQTAKLDQLCARAAVDERGLETVNVRLSKTCAARVQNAQRIQAYRKEESAPSTEQWSNN